MKILQKQKIASNLIFTKEELAIFKRKYSWLLGSLYMKGAKKKVPSVGFENFLWSMVCNGEQDFRKYGQRVQEKKVEHHAINVN